jgi:hypothetical protein
VNGILKLIEKRTRGGKIAKTYLCTSTFPNVKETMRISNSSGLAEKASIMARMSSTP